MVCTLWPLKMAPVAGLRATTTPDPLASCPTARQRFLDAQATPDMKMPETACGSSPLRTIAVSGLSGTAMPLVSLRLSPTAKQAEPDGQLTPLRNPLDPMSWSDCPVEKSPDAGLRDATPPKVALDATFPTPMHRLAEAQATLLKVVMGLNSCATTLADVVAERADEVARAIRASTRSKEPIRKARVHEFITSL
jgi:hypothetical protein